MESIGDPFLSKRRQRSYRTLTATFVAALSILILFELLKNIAFEWLRPLESIAVTIVFVSILTTIAAFAVLKRRESYFRRYAEERHDRKDVEERLSLLAYALRCITECVTITDMNDNIIFVNDAFTKTYGYTRDEILDRSVDLLRSRRNEPERIKNILPATIAGGWNGELWNVRKDGREFPIYLSTSVVRNEQGRPMALVGIATDITQRKEAERAILESEERYRRLVELSPEAIVVHSEGRLVYANPAAVKMYGAKSDKQLMGRPILEFVHPDSRSLVSQRVRQTSIEGRDAPVVEERFLRVDGSAFDVEVVSIPFTFQKKSSVLVLVRDISQRKEAEEALRESEARYRFLADNVNDVIWTLDANERFTYVSPSVEKLRGYTPDEVLQQSLEEVLTPTSLVMVRGFITEAFARIQKGERDFTPAIVEVEQPCKDGSRVWTEVIVNILFDQSNNFECFLGASRNIAERKHAEQALRVSEERFRNLAENTQDVFWMVSPDYKKVLYVNPSYERVWGRKREDLYNDPVEWTDAIHPEDVERVTKAVAAQMELAGDFEADYRLLHRDGSVRWVQDKGFPIRGEQGIVIAFAGVARDISDRKQAEEALLQAQKMESLGILAGGIAHDFNNLLQAMLGQTYLALKKLNPESAARENIEKAQKAAVRAADLTQQMLAYSGRGKFNVRKIDLNTIIRENVHLLEAGIPKNIRLDLNLAKSAVHIEADVAQMQQITMNLVINAAEAIEGRPGTVTVSTHRRTIPTSEANAWMVPDGGLIEGEYVILEVADNGSGMDTETLKRIFDPFFTTKFTGRGLGLAAVLGIVRGHQGGLQVHTEPGQGTAFRIALPAVHGVTGEGSKSVTPRATLHIDGYVLLIDDEASVREVFADTLSDYKIGVITAAGGEEGIDVYRRRMKEIALVVLDLSMPGMGGEETYRKLKQVNPAVKVVLSSGFAEEEATKRFVGLGLNGFIQKPYQWEKLLENLHRVAASI